MGEVRQKSIAVTPEEKDQLEEVKRKYEGFVGHRVYWGNFLHTMAVLGSIELGVYGVIKSNKPFCPKCGHHFCVAYPEDSFPVTYVTCPKCGQVLVAINPKVIQ